MKLVVLMRHGKSDWNAGARDDHSRPLAPRGERAAAAMGRILASGGVVPDLVVTSSANRARSTAELAVEAMEADVPIRVTDVLYGASPGMVFDQVHALEPHVDSVMLVGHEPTWSATAQIMTGAAVLVRTATVVGIEFPAARWPQVSPGGGALWFVHQPRLLS